MTILIVDDERDAELLFRQRFRKELRGGALNLVFAFSGEEALSYFSSDSADAVLLLSDINMPGMNGLDLLQHIKTNRPELPVFMVTAYAGEFQSRAMELGADGYINKPIDFEALKNQILTVSGGE
ncbi:MAG: response regulator [Saprospiraceae bacterium]